MFLISILFLHFANANSESCGSNFDSKSNVISLADYRAKRQKENTLPQPPRQARPDIANRKAFEERADYLLSRIVAPNKLATPREAIQAGFLIELQDFLFGEKSTAKELNFIPNKIQMQSVADQIVTFEISRNVEYDPANPPIMPGGKPFIALMIKPINMGPANRIHFRGHANAFRTGFGLTPSETADLHVTPNGPYNMIVETKHTYENVEFHYILSFIKDANGKLAEMIFKETIDGKSTPLIRYFIQY